MIQLTYISSATFPCGSDGIEEILQSARRNNARRQITGLLLYDGRRFLQTLEGPALAVSETFFRIKADKRHKAIVQLSSNDIQERAFGEWAMAAQRIGSSGSVADQVETLTEQVADANLRETFRSFAQIRSAA